MIEQENKPKNWVLIGGVGIFVIILFVSAYYLFFKNPQVIEELTVSPDQKQVEVLSQIKPDYTKLVEQLNKFYKKGEEQKINTPQLGRQNPFQQL
ncbi:MAG: hypothetical protein LiPW41_26 [Parcubacteria group bacterium LiPW_41]|nr:MAG: hypothetical protein LiPW41_26 [Parcubacteria group bacterium LiPW_41]